MFSSRELYRLFDKFISFLKALIILKVLNIRGYYVQGWGLYTISGQQHFKEFINL